MTCATLHYLLDNYGEEAFKDVLTSTAQRVYKTMHEELIRGGCGELEEYWRHYMEREGGDFALEKTSCGLKLTVRDCPALRHLAKLGQQPDPILCEATRVFNEALAAGSPFAARVERTGMFSCVQEVRK